MIVQNAAYLIAAKIALIGGAAVLLLEAVVTTNGTEILKFAETPLIVTIVAYGYQKIFKAWREDSASNAKDNNEFRSILTKQLTEASSERRELAKGLNSLNQNLSDYRADNKEVMERINDVHQKSERILGLFIKNQ